MPFPRNHDFVGRTDDLERLHATLQQREPVGIRPAGLTGMGGIGKTQLAVEYVYRFKDAYPHGIFWINAAEPLAQGLAQIGSRLRPQVLERTADEQLRAAFDELKRRPDALLVLDNLEDPAQLHRSVGTEASPLTLGCRILFTTRRRELGRFQPIEVSVLPGGPALQLLLRDDSRHPVRDDRDHPERSGATAICRMLGYLPLALELASAFLAEWPEVSLADYRMRLEKEGCLSTLDSEVANLAPVNFEPIHEVAVAATLKTQWEALRPGDEMARLAFRVAGQFTEAAAIPVATLGLFAGVSLASRPGNPSLLQRALKRLHDVRLIGELHEKRIRLHPLVREFARSLTPEAETPEFRHACARHVAQAFEDFATLENTVQAKGVDLVQQALITALEFAPETQYPARDALTLLIRCLGREAHHLRAWHREHQPGLLAQQLLFRATTLGQRDLADRAEHRLETLARPYLALRWRTYRESPALLRVLTGHQDQVNSVALSGDGRYIVSGSNDGTVVVWDLQTGARLHELTGHQDWVNSVALSGDGRYIVSGSDDRTVAVWDLQTGARLHQLTGHQGRVRSVALSGDGRHIVSGSSDKTVAVWDLQTGARLHQLTGHQDWVNSVALSGDGRHIVSGSSDKTVAVWDLQTGARLHQLTGHQDWVNSVALSGDGRHIVSGSDDRTVAVWDLQTGARLHELTGHQGRVRSVALSGDGRHIVSGSSDKTVAVWDLQTGARLHELTGHQGRVRSVALSGDGRHIVSGSSDKTVAVWDLQTGARLHQLTGHQDWVNSVALSSDGRYIVSGSGDRTVAVWDLQTGARLHELTGHRDWVRSVAMSGDGRYIVSGSDDRTVAVWDLQTGARLHQLTGHQFRVTSVALSGDGRHIVSGSSDKTVAVWDLQTGARLHQLTGHQDWVNSVALSGDGRHIVSGSSDKTVAVWDLQTGARLHELTGHQGRVRSVALSGDGRHIVSGSSDKTVAVWDLQTGARLHQLTGHQDWVNSVALSGDGRHIVSGSDDGTVAVWDLQTGARLATLALDGAIACLRWHPADRFLVAGDVIGNLYCLEYRQG